MSEQRSEAEEIADYTWLDTPLRNHYAQRVIPPIILRDSLHKEIQRQALEQETLKTWIVILGNTLASTLLLTVLWILLGTNLLVWTFALFSALSVLSSMIIALLVPSHLIKGGHHHAVVRN
ncbi:MAG: hypothetical protein FWE76_03500 [Symbiobacteriaceae bacterium]|nr:hypothetical protein [Symbiobacteriaceae bacterium]